jgi:uncharacterized protein (DUF58 family)
LRRAHLVELRARRLVTDLLSGPYRSIFRGRGLEFDDIREYQPGDDVRSIDWHATARSGTVQIKNNVEERCLTAMVAVDLSASADFGSVPQSKRELAAELAAVFALSAVSNNDRVGLAIFTDGIELYLPPRTGRRQALAIVSSILAHQPRSRRTSMDKALRTLGSVLRHRASVFLISDFLDDNFARALRLVSLRHDVVAVSIRDPVEASLPKLGWLVCEDAETGDLVELHTSDPRCRHAFEVDRLARTAALQETFRRAGVDAIYCETGAPYQRALLQFFDRRQQRLGPTKAVVA